MKSVSVYYDVVSPYSWLAFEVVNRYEKIWTDVSFSYIPFFLYYSITYHSGGVMSATENVPPGSNPYKARYMMSDLERLKKQFNIPLGKMPEKFPFNTLPAQRILTVVKKEYPEKLVPLSKGFWNRCWGQGVDIGSEEEVMECLQKLFSKDEIKDLIQKSSGSSAKEELQRVTKEAVQCGSFGAPWIVVKNGSKTEYFWGSDRFEAISYFLEKSWLGPNPKIAKM